MAFIYYNLLICAQFLLKIYNVRFRDQAVVLHKSRMMESYLHTVLLTQSFSPFADFVSSAYGISLSPGCQPQV